MSDNYEQMASGARQLFLSYDQEEMIRRWDVRADENYLFPVFLGRELPIDRRTGEGGDVHETMILFDLLTYAKERPHPTGEWVSISGIGGIIGAGHDRTLRPDAKAVAFAGKKDDLLAACRKIGGEPFPKGDVGWTFCVFADFKVTLQFWDADEDFPASLTWFFDRNALKYMHYETLWYVMNVILERIESHIG